VAQFIIAIDYNNVYVALPDIGRELGFSSQSLQWVVSAYRVAFGGLLLLGGRAADRLGARRMFILALLVLRPVLAGRRARRQAGGAVAAARGTGHRRRAVLPAVLALINTRFAQGRERKPRPRGLGIDRQRWGWAAGDCSRA